MQWFASLPRTPNSAVRDALLSDRIKVLAGPWDTGAVQTNEPVRVYDCSGPWGDPAFTGSVAEGLPSLRRDWILKRGDVAWFRLDVPAAPKPGTRAPAVAKPGGPTAHPLPFQQRGS